MDPVVAQGWPLGPGVYGAGVVFALVALDLAIATSAAAVGPRVVGAVTDWRPPARVRSLRDRYVPRPLDAFLLGALAAASLELLRSRPVVAAGVAACSVLVVAVGSLVVRTGDGTMRPPVDGDDPVRRDERGG